MESSFKPLPPPPTPNDGSNHSPVPTTPTTPSPRIRRKPLPPSAFSPQSIISSPVSVYLEQEFSKQNNPPKSSGKLEDVLSSPSPRVHVAHVKRQNSAKRDSLPPIPPLSQISSTESRSESIPKIAIPEFSISQKNAVALGAASDEEPHKHIRCNENMAPKNIERPPPLRMDSIRAIKTLDAKKPQSPGSVFTSFFTRRATPSPHNVSPGVESSATDISDSQATSPYIGSSEEAGRFSPQRHVLPVLKRQDSYQTSEKNLDNDTLQRMDSTLSGFRITSAADASTRCAVLETELKELSKELAGSIRRELDLEDLVEKLQAEHPRAYMSVDRTSDYFSDSGTSSSRHPGSEYNAKEELDKVKREAEQQRAQLKIEFSQKWQSEITERKRLESHVQILESRLSQTRQITNETSDASARIRELEVLLDDARRRLIEERQTKENFEDLLNALRVELEQHRNERDNLRDEVVPSLHSQIEGLESSFSETQKQAYELTKMQQEIQSLRDENMAISSARKMEQEIMRSGMQYIPQEGIQPPQRLSLIVPQSSAANRSSTTSSRGMPAALNLSRSASLSRPGSLLSPPQPETPNTLTEKLTAVEQQRDALHSAVKYLRNRFDHQTKTHEKRIHTLTAQIESLSSSANENRRGGYEREVRQLRQEINLLRRRADDALDQKWQCEKGLAGLKMDLDRSKQETASLQRLFETRNGSSPEQLSDTLEDAMKDLQHTQAHCRETVSFLTLEQRMATELQESAQRAEMLATQVRQQLDANGSLRERLLTAVASGELNQQASAVQISELQANLKRLEDTIHSSQLQSETAVMKHEEEIRTLKASHNMQLMRAKAGLKSPVSGQMPPLSPLFMNRNPRLETTSSGPGMALNQAMKTTVLENKVGELERALRDAENEMEQVVGRMNKAQIEVFELQQERDEEQRRTQKLEAAVKAERATFQALLASTGTTTTTTMNDNEKKTTATL